MADTEVRVCRSPDGQAPLVHWLMDLRKKKPKVWTKCIARIRDLAREGFRLQRPRAAPLGDGIHELRPKSGRINYRILYFFHSGKAFLTHGLTKEKEVPPEEIELAKYYRKLIQIDEDKYAEDFG